MSKRNPTAGLDTLFCFAHTCTAGAWAYEDPWLDCMVYVDGVCGDPATHDHDGPPDGVCESAYLGGGGPEPCDFGWARIIRRRGDK